MKRPDRRLLLAITLALAWIVIAIFGSSSRAWDPIVGEWKEQQQKMYFIEIGLRAAPSPSAKAQYHFKRDDDLLNEWAEAKAKVEPRGLPYRSRDGYFAVPPQIQFLDDGTFRLSDDDGEYLSGRWERDPGPVYLVTVTPPSRIPWCQYYTGEELSSLPDLADLESTRRIEPCPRGRAYRLLDIPCRLVINEENLLAVTGDWTRFRKDEPDKWSTKAYRQIRNWLGLTVTPAPPSTPAPHPVPVPTPPPPPASP